MSQSKLNWQWQGTVVSSVAPKSNPNPHTGRVITGMLTGGHSDQFQTPSRSSRGSDGNNNGFGC